MTHFVFCHGWGLDIHFWQRIAPYFSQQKCSFIDLGYFDHPQDIPYSDDRMMVGIGHSMGLSKLAARGCHWQALIGLNGFIDFLGSNPMRYPQRQRELKMLVNSFIQDPKATLQRFYTRCGLSDLMAYQDFSNLNRDLILSDLRGLSQAVSCPTVPVLMLCSDDDIIVPSAITRDYFSPQSWVTIDNINGAGHGLGYNKPAEVYDKIMGFLND